MHHKNQIHQQNGDAERREDAAEDFLLIFHFPTGRNAVTGWQGELVQLFLDIGIHFAERPSLRVRFDHHDVVPIQMTDQCGSDTLLDRRDLPHRNDGRASVRALYHQWQPLDIRRLGSRFRSKPHPHLPILARRIDPIASIHTRKSRPQRLRHLSHGDSHRTGELTVEINFEFRLLSFGRQSHVNRAGNFFHHRHDRIGKSIEHARVLAAQLDLNLLAPAAKAAGIHVDRRTANLFYFIANYFAELNLTDRPSRLRHHSHIDIPNVCGSNRAACLLARTRSTHGRERVAHEIGVGAHHACRLFCLQARVFQIRTGRRLNLHRHFTAIRIRHKSKATISRLQPNSGEKCERCQRHH